MWYAIFGVVGAVLTLVLHEFSHCLVVWVCDGKVVSFRPWPHWENGRFFFGTMTFDSPWPPNRKWFVLAPFLKALLFFLFWIIMGWHWHPLWLLAGWEATDWGNWLQGYIRLSNNDGGKFRKLPSING